LSYRPVDKEELFNLRHAQARNCIERIFGVLKKRFRILLLAPEYKKDKDLQNRIPTALVAIHNFIRHHDPNEERLPGSDVEYILPHAGDTSTPLPAPPATQSAAAARRDVNNRRDAIAQAMWDDYQALLRARTEQDAQVNQYLYDDIESPCTTRLLGNEDPNTDQYADIDMGDDNRENDEREGYNWEGYNSEDYAGEEDGGEGVEGRAIESI
jgi:hypothetical protein